MTSRQSKYRPSKFFFTNFVLFNIGVATMKENKGKGVASRTEGEEDVQVLDDVTPLVV